MSAPQENAIPAELLQEGQNTCMFRSCVTCIYITFAFRWLTAHLVRHSKAEYYGKLILMTTHRTHNCIVIWSTFFKLTSSRITTHGTCFLDRILAVALYSSGWKLSASAFKGNEARRSLNVGLLYLQPLSQD